MEMSRGGRVGNWWRRNGMWGAGAFFSSICVPESARALDFTLKLYKRAGALLGVMKAETFARLL